ncbi:MAG: dihydropteroate synthase [Bacteroidetes bacterium HGW-Bacteroidetes-4]|jgi:dihydropteroate synthase|nr:MAG: dihydropteroate synthase [Bacteroidetes bacterium HGW-Bacteroidetes-4]
MVQSSLIKPHFINCKGRLIDLSVPKVMGILNVTPDSFYSISRVSDKEQVKQKVAAMLTNGADFIDVGAYSTRPGADFVSEDEEWNRVEPVLNLIQKEFPEALISIDTYRSSVAQRAVSNFGVALINDISAGNLDAKMFETVAHLNVPYIIMHMIGTPQNMQQNVKYRHLMQEVFTYFAEKIERLKKMQVPDVIIDPGFGFSKTLEQNYEILSKLDEFVIFERPVLVGVSRKTMIYKQLNTDPERALNGTTVLNTLALTKGANILRVHDVKEAKEAVELYLKTKQFS